MIQVRTNLFETNSSSTHSLVMCTAQQLRDYEDGKLLLNIYDGSFEPIENEKDYDLHLNENNQPVLNGVVYKDLEDLFYQNLDEGYEWLDGYNVPYWMLTGFGGFYSCDIGEMNGVGAIAVEYNNEI